MHHLPCVTHQVPCAPLPVYTVVCIICPAERDLSLILSPVFSDINTYLEFKSLPFDTPPNVQWIDQYDYESDSDLGYHSDTENLERSTIAQKSRYVVSLPMFFSSLLTGCQVPMIQWSQSIWIRPETKVSVAMAND